MLLRTAHTLRASKIAPRKILRSLRTLRAALREHRLDPAADFFRRYLVHNWLNFVT